MKIQRHSCPGNGSSKGVHLLGIIWLLPETRSFLLIIVLEICRGGDILSPVWPRLELPIRETPWSPINTIFPLYSFLLLFSTQPHTFLSSSFIPSSSLAPAPSPSQALYPHVNSTSQWLQTNMSSKQKSKLEKFHKKREEGFDLGSVPHAKLKSYSALHDPNMRHYFENPNVQRLLYNSGQIDSHGRVINLQKNKTKLQILEREFKEAEIAEMKKLREEEEMRVSSVVV